MARPQAPLWSATISPGNRLPTPGPVFGSYPMRDAPPLSSHAWLALVQAWWRGPRPPWRWQARAFVAGVRQSQRDWAGLTPDAHARRLASLRASLAVKGFQRAQVSQAMGALSDLVHRRLGWQVHEVQLMGAWWMLGNRLIEMATGEGKSLTVVLAAGTAALAGVPVHVMTANDYLARRDAEQWAPFYEALGLTVAWVTSASTPQERQQAYQCDLVYVTAKEVAFDHLRDRAAKAQGNLGALVLKGLCMAVIDEADSMLIDEACTPLVLSQVVQARQAEHPYRLALFLARQIQPGRDVEWGAGQALQWLPAGLERLDQLCANLQGAWRLKRYREEQVGLALTALHVLVRDVHYLLRDDEVHIIDGTTGRLAIGRSWSRGLHQMVCIKESVSPSAETETLTQTSYQEFFPRYHRLCGLSGTLWEERRELLTIYGLPVVRVPLRLPSQRRDAGLHIADSALTKWDRVADHATRQAVAGRAVLVGTHSVADSEHLSAVLTRRGVAHRVLNARHDGEAGTQEREVIEAACRPGAITVATHMAGRGTDIQLGPEVLDRGGLHVINTHLNASRRIDRQLYGRSGRQGQPGSHECVLSWGDQVMEPLARHPWLMGVLRMLAACRSTAAPTVRLLCAWLQMIEGQQGRQRRWSLLRLQDTMRRQLAWAGREEWS